jgi:hypothetical protein
MAGWLYLAGYLVVVPLVAYLPTHLALMWWAKRRGIAVVPVES